MLLSVFRLVIEEGWNSQENQKKKKNLKSNPLRTFAKTPAQKIWKKNKQSCQAIYYSWYYFYVKTYAVEKYMIDLDFYQNKKSTHDLLDK